MLSIFRSFFMRAFRRGSGKQNAIVRKPYQKPAAREVTLEQAILKLIGYASVGDQGAKHLLDLAFKAETKNKRRSA